MKKTPTPRTAESTRKACEKITEATGHLCSGLCYARDSAQLEIELAEAKRIQDDLYARCKSLQKRLRHEEGEVVELTKDKERLNALQQMAWDGLKIIIEHDEMAYKLTLDDDDSLDREVSLRKAIDERVKFAKYDSKTWDNVQGTDAARKEASHG